MGLNSSLCVFPPVSALTAQDFHLEDRSTTQKFSTELVTRAGSQAQKQNKASILKIRKTLTAYCISLPTTTAVHATFKRDRKLPKHANLINT